MVAVETPMQPHSTHVDQRFRKVERLRRRDDFQRVFAHRCSGGDEVMVVYARPNDLAWSRLGLSVAKHLGRAVDRNGIRRRIREAFRRHKREIPRGFDYVCVAKSGAAERSADVSASLCKLAASAVRRCRRRERTAPPASDRSTTTPAPNRRSRRS